MPTFPLGTLSWAPGNRGWTQNATGGTEVRAAGERPWVGVPGSNTLSHRPPPPTHTAASWLARIMVTTVKFKSREGNHASSSLEWAGAAMKAFSLGWARASAPNPNVQVKATRFGGKRKVREGGQLLELRLHCGEAESIQVGMEGGDYSCSLALHQSECASK